MGVLAWSPLGRGVLTGKYRGGVPSDSRAADPAWEAFVSKYLTPQKSAVVEALARASEGLDVTIAHVALAWLLARPAVASAVVGARTTSQLQENLASEDLELPPEIVQALDDVSDSARVRGESMIEYEFWNLTIDRTKSRTAVCRMLTDAAEYQGWELDRLRKDDTGQRTVVLRRKIIRMRSTL